MKKVNIYKFLICLFISIFLLSDITYALLIVLSPEGMIEYSDFIFTGKVIEKNYAEDQRTVKIEIDRILKGDESIGELTLTRQNSEMYGWLGFDFPDPGNKVFVLLSKTEQGYMPCFDLNYVAVINKDEKIELYNGHIINGIQKEEYAAVYQKFFDENYDKAIIPKKETAKYQVDKYRNKPIIYIFMSLIITLIILSIALFFKKKIRDNNI